MSNGVLTGIPEGKATGCLPRRTMPGSRFPSLEQRLGAIPRSEWEARCIERCKPTVANRPKLPYIHDQSQTSSCTTQGGAAVLETVRVAMGAPSPRLAPVSVYREINGGRDNGSAIDECCRQLAEVGICTAEFWGADSDTNWRKNPPGWEANAARNRITEWLDVTTYDGLQTALLCGYLTLIGVPWDGGGHAIAAVDPIWRRGASGVVFANSWGAEWGDGGWGELWEPQITEGLRMFGAFAVRAGTIDGT